MSSEAALAGLDVEMFWEKGYAILPGFYTADEVAAFRTAAYASRGKGGDLLVNPHLKHVLLDGRLVAVSRRLLGSEDIVYVGDSSFTINSNSRGWHKDNTDRLDPDAPDWKGRYTQLRFGIYCQDHSEHTGGLNLRVGSHDIPPDRTGAGDNLYVKCKPGDLVVWSMRITHSGNGMLLKDPKARFPLPNEQRYYSADEVAAADGDRIAIFAHLGANDDHAKRYAEYLKTRKYMVEAWRKRPYPPEVLEQAKAAGLSVRDMPAEVMHDPTAGQNEEWKPFPYSKPGAGTSERAAAGVDSSTGKRLLVGGREAAQSAAFAARRRIRGTLGGAYRGWKESAR